MTALHIAKPCHESWDAMTPNHQGRHCASCEKTVVDVTAMAPSDARDYLARELPTRVSRGERVCVRAHADRRGRLMRGGVTRRLLTNGLAAVLAMAMADVIAPTLNAAEDAPGVELQPIAGEAVMPIPPRMGKIAMPKMGDVKCDPAPEVEPLTIAASGVTITADSANFRVIATRADKTVAWTVDLTTRGIPGDDDHYIRQLLNDGQRLVVCYGGDPNGEPLQLRLDPATGASVR